MPSIPATHVHHDHSPMSLSLETLIGTSGLWGHDLESCAATRDSQDQPLVNAMALSSAVSLRNKEQQQLFAVAPLDILVTEVEGEKKFHIIELNGTGIGGLTNMNHTAVRAVMQCMEQMPAFIDKPAPMIIVGSSGRESAADPRLNKLIYEKLLYADAIRAGFLNRYAKACVTSMANIAAKPEILARMEPTVIVGYMKEFLSAMTCHNGRLFLGERQVDGMVNDRMCLNLFHKFDYKVDLSQLVILNRTYLPGADKGVAYRLLNDYLQEQPSSHFPRQIYFSQAHDREELISAVLAEVRSGRRLLIKPRGTGLGHGIEFFLDPREEEAAIIARIDQSLRLTEQFYGLEGGALPYTLCDYVDTCAIKAKDHPMFGHKYELRVVVYRDGMELKAFPSIVKISSQAFDGNNINRMMLINNITASAAKTKQAGANFKLPLCNWEVLDLLGMRREHLQGVCRVATGYVRSLLDRIQTHPGDLGLPAASDTYLLPRREHEYFNA